MTARLILPLLFFPFFLQAAADREAARSTVMIPVVGTVPGANGTRFQTDLTISNRTTNTTIVEVYWLPQNVSGTGVPAAQLTLQSFETRLYEDFVRVTLGKSGLGAVILRGTREGGTSGNEDVLIDAYARVWTPANDGGGTFSAGIPASTLYGPKVDDFEPIAGHVYGLRQDRDFRSNFGIVNMGARTLTFAVYANTNDAPVSVPFIVTVPPNSMVQRAVPFGIYGGLTLTIFPQQTTPPVLDLGPWTAYGTSVDNATGDAWFSKAQASRLHQDPM
jgi:hypothetical protein